MLFPPFAVDSHRHVLTRDGEDVALSPHLVDILIYLATRSGEIVSKDTLLEEFWPDVHVTDSTLTRAIADIRKALGDDAGEPQFIRTVARRGYRFIVPVKVDEDTRRHDPFSGGGDPFREWVRGRLSLEALDASKLPACFLQFECTRAENTPDREPLLRAISHARRACELDQTLGEAWATLGVVLTAAGQGEEARAAARRAAALEPTSWRHHFRLGVASWGEERLRAVDRTLSLLPGFAPARFLAAMVFTARHAFGPAAEAAATGAAAQAREASHEASLFPAVGLHWLHGLLLLRNGHVGPAITSFAHEIDQSQSGQIYAREFRVNAQVAAGFAHLAAHDPAGATDAFRSALETLPRNGRALIGLYRALEQTSFAAEPPQLLPKIDGIVAELASGGRLAEAAIVSAASHVARGDVRTACSTLQRLLDDAPPGQAGWLIPIDPALATLRSSSGFEKIAAQLAARAA